MSDRRSSLIYSVLILLAGIVLGLALDGWPSARSLQARALDPNEVDRLYSELQSGNTTLHDFGRVLSRIYDLTSPSVVHIQSEYRDAKRGHDRRNRFRRHHDQFEVPPAVHRDEPTRDQRRESE